MKPHALALICARLAAERTAANLHRKFNCGVFGLRAVSRIAPLLGLFGSVFGLANVFRAEALGGCCGGCACAGPAEAFVPVFLSLPVAIFGFAGLHYLSRRSE